MPRYRVHFTQVITSKCYIEYDAEDENEAYNLFDDEIAERDDLDFERIVDEEYNYTEIEEVEDD